MDTTIKTIEATPTPLAIVVDKRNQISKIAVNKIVRDIVSKSEIILQEVTVPGLVDSIFTKTRKNRRNPYVSANINPLVRSSFRSYYTKQIMDNDNTLKQLRENVVAIKTLFENYLASYSLSYAATIHIEDLMDMLSETYVGSAIANVRLDHLSDIVSSTRETLTILACNLEPDIRRESVRLNSIDAHLSKNSRKMLLAQFAEQKLQEIIIIRDDFKRSIQDEYQTYAKERITTTTSYENHGPTPIL